MSHMGQWNLCGEQRNNCLPSIAWKTPTSALFDYTKAFDWVDHKKLWNILKEMEYQTTLPASCLLGKEYLKAVYCHHAYLTSMQSTSCEMPV